MEYFKNFEEFFKTLGIFINFQELKEFFRSFIIIEKINRIFGILSNLRNIQTFYEFLYVFTRNFSGDFRNFLSFLQVSGTPQELLSSCGLGFKNPATFNTKKSNRSPNFLQKAPF
jgi:hypothetical protein